MLKLTSVDKCIFSVTAVLLITQWTVCTLVIQYYGIAFAIGELPPIGPEDIGHKLIDGRETVYVFGVSILGTN